jgi:hydroxyacylglutathione hydrolase
LAEVVKENKVTVGHSTIADEKTWNVFMRLGTDAKKYVYQYIPLIHTPNRRRFVRMQDLRDKKDNYKE